MTRARSVRVGAFLAGAALAALGASIALGQDNRGHDRPESILPPGFNDPVATPAPAPAPSAAPRQQQGGTVVTPVAPATDGALPAPAPSASSSAAPVNPAIEAAIRARYEIPPYARRSIDLQLMTPQQRAVLMAKEDLTAADLLIIESPATQGIVFIRGFVREEGARESVRKLLGAAKCGPLSR